MLICGSMLLKGDGVPVNKAEAADYFKMAADSGSEKAKYLLGLQLDDGDGIPMNKRLSVMYYQKAADKSIIQAMLK